MNFVDLLGVLPKVLSRLTPLNDVELLLVTLIMLRTLRGYVHALSESVKEKSKSSQKERNDASSEEKTSDKKETQTESDEGGQR